MKTERTKKKKKKKWKPGSSIKEWWLVSLGIQRWRQILLHAIKREKIMIIKVDKCEILRETQKQNEKTKRGRWRRENSYAVAIVVGFREFSKAFRFLEEGNLWYYRVTDIVLIHMLSRKSYHLDNNINRIYHTLNSRRKYAQKMRQKMQKAYENPNDAA